LTRQDFYFDLASTPIGEQAMKQKVGTVLEEDVLRRAKRRAVDEGRPLSELIQDALERYLTVGMPEPARRDAAYQLFCEQPMQLSPEQFRTVLEHDGWDL